MLYLQRPEIEALVNIEEAFPAIENAYIALSQGRVNLPPVGHITFPNLDADCHIKYGHIEGDDFFVIKVATGFPHNKNNGLENGNGMLLVMSAETGKVKAMLHDEMHLTDVRSSIGGAIASYALARQNAQKVLIVGTGIQAKMQIKAHALKFQNDLEFSIWGRSLKKAQAIIDELSGEFPIKLAEDLEVACKDADIIVTTTGATQPIIKAEWINQGTHVTAIGADAPGKQELEEALIAKADLIIADSISQCIHHGEIEEAIKQGLLNADQIVELGQVLENKELERSQQEQITIADLTGIAAQDIAIAGVILEEHQKRS